MFSYTITRCVNLWTPHESGLEIRCDGCCCVVGIYFSSLSLCANILQSAPLGQGASRLLQIFCLMRYGIWKALGPARAVALLSISRNSESTDRVSCNIKQNVNKKQSTKTLLANHLSMHRSKTGKLPYVTTTLAMLKSRLKLWPSPSTCHTHSWQVSSQVLRLRRSSVNVQCRYRWEPFQMW